MAGGVAVPRRERSHGLEEAIQMSSSSGLSKLPWHQQLAEMP